MAKIAIPEGLIELLTLEKQYPNWDKTPEFIKEKMLALALANEGFMAFKMINKDKENQYLKYIYNIIEELHDCYVSDEDRKQDIVKLTNRLRCVAGILYGCYSPSRESKKSTERNETKIYVQVERYLLKNTSSSINQAVKEVAKKLKLDYQYVYRRYYKMRNKVKGISLEEIIERFGFKE